MATRQEAIIQKIMTRLTSGLPTYNPPVAPITGLKTPHRSVSRPLDEDELPTFVAAVVQNNEDDAEGDTTMPDGPYRRVMWVWVEARCLGASSDSDGPAEKYLDPYVEFCYRVLLSDPQLDGLCDRIEPERVIYEGWQGKHYYLAGAMLFRVYYLGDPI